MFKNIALIILALSFLSIKNRKIENIYLLRIYNGYNDSVSYYIDIAFEYRNNSQKLRTIQYINSIKDTINIDSFTNFEIANFFFKNNIIDKIDKNIPKSKSYFENFFYRYRKKESNFYDTFKNIITHHCKIELWQLKGSILKLNKNFSNRFFYRNYNQVKDSSLKKVKQFYVVKILESKNDM